MKLHQNQTVKPRKVVLVGTGMVGMSYAYAMLNQGRVCDQLVLVDLNTERAQGEAMDLNHGVAFSGGNMKIYAGTYSDCADADIVAICAGVAQKPGESRLELLERNAAVFRSIIGPVIHSGFDGCFLIATNPVDVMSYVTWKLSGWDANRIVGSGTALDTARLRYLLGDYFGVDPRNVHAYVMGEHGDSEFVPWSQAKVATIEAVDFCQKNGRCSCEEDMQQIAEDVRNAAQQIINAKKATYYGIGMAMVRITRAILSNENSVLTVSTMPDGEYGLQGAFAGFPTVVNQKGADRIIELDLTPQERAKLERSFSTLRELCEKLNLSPVG